MNDSSRRAFLARTAAATAAFGAAAGGRAYAQEAASINVAAIPSDIAGSAYYAQDNGFFKKAGLDGKFLSLSNGGAITAAVLGGGADVGYSNVITLAIAHTKGLPITILMPANLHVHAVPTAGLLAVKADSPIKTGKDFNGKIVAVSGLNNIADIAMRVWIDKNGGDSKTVKSVELPFPTMKAAAEAGRVDAVALDQTGDPLLGKPGDTLRLVASTFDAVSQNFAPSVWFSTTTWVNANQVKAKAFATAMRESAVWANAHHRESAEMLAKWTHETPEQVQSLPRVTYGDRLTAALIQPNIDVAAKYGVLSAAFPAGDIISSLVN